MEQPRTNGEHDPLTRLEIGALPMTQEEALNILKAVAVKYAPAQPLTSELDDWVAGCTEDFGD